MTLDELLAWSDERRRAHQEYLEHLVKTRRRAINKMQREDAIRHQREVVKQFELVVDGLRREVENGARATNTRDGTTAGS